MISKEFVPFGGVRGWIADLTVANKAGSRRSKPTHVIESYYAAEPNERYAMAAIRHYAKASKDAVLVARQALSRREIVRLGMRPGQVMAV
jgi:hypothetical protein